MGERVDELKAAAGIAAAAYVKSGMKVGLGTGSTVSHTVIEVGRRVREEGLDIVAVPTSVQTDALARKMGITLVELGSISGLDIVIDGTDEFDPCFQLIKGGGGALLREKIVAQAAAGMIVVADQSKQVAALGAFPLPIEVTPFAWRETQRQVKALLGCEVELRRSGGGAVILQDVNVEDGPFVTDNGNLILDAHCGARLTDPKGVQSALQALAGVCEVGFFIDICDLVILASDDGVSTLIKENGRL